MCLTGLKSWIREAPVSRTLLSVVRGEPLAVLVVGRDSMIEEVVVVSSELKRGGGLGWLLVVAR
jgi:hypothetical protein